MKLTDKFCIVLRNIASYTKKSCNRPNPNKAKGRTTCKSGYSSKGTNQRNLKM